MTLIIDLKFHTQLIVPIVINNSLLKWQFKIEYWYLAGLLFTKSISPNWSNHCSL